MLCILHLSFKRCRHSRCRCRRRRHHHHHRSYSFVCCCKNTSEIVSAVSLSQSTPVSTVNLRNLYIYIRYFFYVYLTTKWPSACEWFRKSLQADKLQLTLSFYDDSAVYLLQFYQIFHAIQWEAHSLHHSHCLHWPIYSVHSLTVKVFIKWSRLGEDEYNSGDGEKKSYNNSTMLWPFFFSLKRFYSSLCVCQMPMHYSDYQLILWSNSWVKCFSSILFFLSDFNQ